jgi:outer membrane immunogenic protein
MRSSRCFLSSAVAAVTITASFAAQAQAPAFDWTGPYVGVNVGEAIHGRTRFDRTTGDLANNTSALSLGLRPAAHSQRDNGFSGGAQVGYNWAMGDRYSMGGAALVLGGEADAQYMDVRRTDTLSNTTLYGPLDVLGTTPTTRVNRYRGDIDFLGTVRGRAGLAFNNVLVYGTGGLAYADVRRRITFEGPNAPTTPFFTGDSNGMKTGWVYGGGVEVAVPTDSFMEAANVFHASGMTIKAEYLHYDLGSDTLRYPGVNGGATIGGYTSRVRTDGDLARVGVNYKF